jgi:hypothetical protein
LRPIPAKNTWKASASHYFVGDTREVPALAVDGTATRWSSGKAQAGDEWLEIDLGATTVIDAVSLEQGEWSSDYPRSYQVRLSNSSRDRNGPVVASGAGSAVPTLSIPLAAEAEGRYLFIMQTGKATTAWWTVSELSVACTSD